MIDNHTSAWEFQHQHWNELGKSMLAEVRNVGNQEVSKIRETLPFGPPSPQLVEDLAFELRLFPISVFRIWAGLTFKRSSAFPKCHPMKLNINSQQRERDQLRHIDIESIGQAQKWKCAYCDVPLTGKFSPLSQGKRYQRDHIVPLASGGLTEQNNVQLTCSRCNQRKNSLQPNQQLTTYMDRKVAQDRLYQACEAIISPIVDSLIWADSLEANCPWCSVSAQLVRRADLPSYSAVFHCKSCRRMFAAINWEGLEDFYEGLSSALRGAWYAEEPALLIVGAIREEDIPKARELVTEVAGNVWEVRKRRHQHNKGGCWCEFGGDEFETIGEHPQAATLRGPSCQFLDDSLEA